MFNRTAWPRRKRPALLVLALSLAVASAFLFLRTLKASAQDTAPSDAAQLIEVLDDIDRLRVLNPLKLTTDQDDKLATALAAAQADYTKKVNALGTSLLAPTTTEVRATKKQVLAGAPIPKDFDDKIKKLQGDFLKKRDELNAANISRVSTETRAILTGKQVAAAIKMEKDLWVAEHPTAKTTDDAKFYNLFVVDTFISYPRIVALLKEMHAATP